ncbi:BMP and activin membrane-bound inhibitor homolog [Oppia nitens]|uniref:BMP and activin membrane-bound inhibitor homolog n=1 Tax=Oppia nitens TaxID=1686743 RepID=UPI0023DA5FD0|nr:BMP and activin membrane-bound inhibitor homolog [Oppia nitens]
MKWSIFFMFCLQLIDSYLCDIRCQCNLPQCVRTGYMCKSTGASAACFSEVTSNVNNDAISEQISRHGCIELLAPHMRHMCIHHNSVSTAGIAVDTGTPLQILEAPTLAGHSHNQLHHNHHRNHNHHNNNNNVTIVCCFEDMCNYVKSTETITKPITRNSDTKLVRNRNPTTSARNIPMNSMWFQVTVITVPIVASIILVVLIFMATKALRQENHKRHKECIKKINV